MQKIRVLLADDHALFRNGLRLLIDNQPDMEIVAEAKDGDETWNLAQSVQPDVVLLDIAMPKMACERVLRSIANAYPETKVIILSATMTEPMVRQMRSLGAVGYIHKTADFGRLSKAIRMVAYEEKVFARSGPTEEVPPFEIKPTSDIDQSGLSHREVELITLVARGYTNKEIAKLMELSVKTVEAYKTKVGTKVGLQSRAAMVSYALKRGWLN